MPDQSFNIIARDSTSKKTVFKSWIGNWDELTLTLCPQFGLHEDRFPFKREDILNEEEITMFKKISYDEESLSVSEEYVTFSEPNFEFTPNEWRNAFVNIQNKYFNYKIENFVNGVNNAEIVKQIEKIRFAQMIFSEILVAINIASQNQLEIAFTFTDF